MRKIMWYREDIQAMKDQQLRKELLELMDSVGCVYLVNGDDMAQFLQDDFLELIEMHGDEWGYELLLRHMDWKALAKEMIVEYSMEETSDGQQWWYQL